MTKPDLYTATQAARVLGLSVKRVRQMIDEGKLTAYSVAPVKIKQLEVIALRNERDASGKITQSDKGMATNSELLRTLKTMNETFIRQLDAVTDSNRRNEENYLQQINALRAELEGLRARKWFRRNV